MCYGLGYSLRRGRTFHSVKDESASIFTIGRRKGSSASKTVSLCLEDTSRQEKWFLFESILLDFFFSFQSIFPDTCRHVSGGKRNAHFCFDIKKYKRLTIEQNSSFSIRILPIVHTWIKTLTTYLKRKSSVLTTRSVVHFINWVTLIVKL
jgi:hypothetical protein